MRAIKRRCWISNQSSSFSPDGEKTKHQKSLPPLSLSLLIPASAQTDRDSFLPTRDSLGRPTERGKWEGAINTLKKLSKWAAPKNLALPKPGKRGGRVNWGGGRWSGGGRGEEGSFSKEPVCSHSLVCFLLTHFASHPSSSSSPPVWPDGKNRFSIFGLYNRENWANSYH